MYGHGISQTGEIIDMAAEKDIIQKSGSWYSYAEERIGQGRENAKQYLEDNPEKREEIYKKVRVAFGMDETPEEKDAAQEKSKEEKDPSTLDLKTSKKK